LLLPFGDSVLCFHVAEPGLARALTWAEQQPMEQWFEHTGVDDRGILRKRVARHMEESGPDINLTPMLDVVMIMLIFFLVAGSYVHEVVIEAQRKQTSNAVSNEPSESIAVKISASDEIWLKNRRIDARSVRANLSRLRAEQPDAKCIVQADNASSTGAVVLVIDAAREAGIHDIALATTGKTHR
jgi:biopolymer transport protein ExbD